MTEEEAVKQIDECLRKANEQLEKAAELAMKHSVPFRWDGPAYGMGGWFEVEGDAYSDPGWLPSSHSC